jgi:transglutaminase-like putative cysteine protease
MIYDLRQTTCYSYASVVGFSRHVLRLTPIGRPRQRVLAHTLDISPAPLERQDGVDFFGNRQTWIALDQPHDQLTVRLAARIVVDAVPPVDHSPPWPAVAEAAGASADLAPLSPAHFLFPSRQVTLVDDIRDYARRSFPADRPVAEAALELGRRIQADFAYDPAATTVTTDPALSFALRRGVCQDFAHIMITGLRGLRIPAAYVSGYLRTVPPPGSPRLEGADAMHAWVLVWCGPDAGWIGIDPTNGISAGTDHIVLAIGRDYADVAPIDGVIYAAGSHQLTVAVDVVPVEPRERSSP